MSLLADPLVFLIIAIVALSILYYYRSTFLLRPKLGPIEAPREERERTTGIPEITECPRCGRTMEEGYLIGPGGIYWSRTAPLFDVMGSARWRYGFSTPFGSQPLGSTMFRGPGRVPHVKAYRCSNCGLVYVDLSRQALGD